jgi:hypothetical protein
MIVRLLANLSTMRRMSLKLLFLVAALKSATAAAANEATSVALGQKNVSANNSQFLTERESYNEFAMVHRPVNALNY